jgi:hypothetical protein
MVPIPFFQPSSQLSVMLPVDRGTEKSILLKIQNLPNPGPQAAAGEEDTRQTHGSTVKFSGYRSGEFHRQIIYFEISLRNF